MLECGTNQELISILPFRRPKAAHYSIMQGYEDSVVLLSNDKADVNWQADLVCTRTPLEAAIDEGNEALVQLLLDDPRVMVGEDASLMRAVRGGSETTIGLPIENGRVDVNSLGEFRRITLYTAASKGCENVTHLLLAAQGINSNQPDWSGWTPPTY